MDGNKHGLIKWEPVNCLLEPEFTVLARISPDYSKCKEMLEERSVIQQVVLGKNGKHMGLCFVGYVDGEGIKRFKISYEWWETNSKGEDVALDAYVNFEIDEEPETIDIVVEKKNGKYSITVNNQTYEQSYGKIIDYSQCFTWIGCGNKTFVDNDDNLRHGAIFYGDISLLHIQDGLLLNRDKELFFNDFESFNVYFRADDHKVIYFSSDFEDVTEYKVMDKSANGNHPLLFDREWLHV